MQIGRWGWQYSHCYNFPDPKYKIDLNKGLSDTNITCE